MSDLTQMIDERVIYVMKQRGDWPASLDGFGTPENPLGLDEAQDIITARLLGALWAGDEIRLITDVFVDGETRYGVVQGSIHGAPSPTEALLSAYMFKHQSTYLENGRIPA